jgi:hypothetical protein
MRDFAKFIIPTTIGFMGAAIAVETLGVSSSLSFGLGFAFSVPVEYLRNRIQS